MSRDALLYDFSALFAGLVWWLSWINLYQQWASIALGGYLAGALLALVGSRLVPESKLLAARIGLAALVGLSTMALPLGLEVVWRKGAAGGIHVQPEVVVVERAGHQAGEGGDPYVEVVRGGHVVVEANGRPVYERFFPYLPLMSVFGLPKATKAPVEVTDARLLFSLTTLALVAVALALSRGRRDDQLRVAQLLLVLPTAALPLATGGDDMPVVALALLAVVLADRAHPLLAGLLAGLAMAMKFTAWPIGLLLLLAARGRSGRQRATLAMAAGEAVAVVPSIAWGLHHGPGAFIQNVVEFPLGLAGVSSPAASNLPGHLVVVAFPGLHRIWPLAMAGVGLLALAWYLWRVRPSRVDQVCNLTAWLMLLAVLLAPATRVGYLVYPINLFAWAWLLRRSSGAPAELVDAVGEGR